LALAFSPDSRILAVDSNHGIIRLVDPETEREFARLEDPDQDAASQIAFTADGTRLVVRSEDSYSTHVWNLLAIRHQLAAMNLDWDSEVAGQELGVRSQKLEAAPRAEIQVVQLVMEGGDNDWSQFAQPSVSNAQPDILIRQAYEKAQKGNWREAAT